MATGTEGVEPFWAIVEVKGHAIFAGLLVEMQLAGSGFIRVDVPAVAPGLPSYSKIISPTAIHMITPTDEQSARLQAMRLAAPAIPASLARLVDGDRW